MVMKIELNGKSLLAIGLLSAGLAFGEYVSVASGEYTSIVVEDSPSNVYTGTDNKETEFPIGHTIVAWLGNGNPGYAQSNVNKISNLYLVNDNEGYMRYASDWYGDHNSGVYLQGEWQYRGYVGGLASVNSGLFVRVK
jgi:hypothetical protein